MGDNFFPNHDSEICALNNHEITRAWDFSRWGQVVAEWRDRKWQLLRYKKIVLRSSTAQLSHHTRNTKTVSELLRRKKAHLQSVMAVSYSPGQIDV